MIALLLPPLLMLVGAVIYGAILFWPVMILFGAVHAQPGLAWVPAIGWEASFFIVALLYLLIPTNTSSSSD